MATTPQILPTSAAEWNELMRQTAAEQHIDLDAEVKKANLPGDRPRDDGGRFVSPAAAAPAAGKEDATEETTIYKQTFNIGGKDVEFDGTTPEEVLAKVGAALKAVTAAPPAQSTSTTAAPTTPDPAAEEKRRQTMFDIGLKLQQGDPTAIETYLKESDFLKNYFSEQGVNIADLKAATAERQTNAVSKQWDEATTAWLAAEGNDYPGGEANKKLMGYKMVELGLHNKPSVESLQTAYAALKKDGMVFVNTQAETTAGGTTATTPKKRATASTLTGTGGGSDSHQQTQDKNKRVEISAEQFNAMEPEAQHAWYNGLLRQGYKPDQIVIKR